MRAFFVVCGLLATSMLATLAAGSAEASVGTFTVSGETHVGVAGGRANPSNPENSEIEAHPPITAGVGGVLPIRELVNRADELGSAATRSIDLSAPPPPRPETVIGADERLQVTNTTLLPYSTITYLDIGFTGFTAACSGTLVGPNVVLTAAHCLYDSAAGYASSVWVAPGQNGLTSPFGSQYAASWVVPNGWVSFGTPAYDWGLIKLPNTALGTAASWRWLGVFGDSTLSSATGSPTIVGYPGDKPLGTMWWGSKSTFSSVTSTDLTYTIDTYAGQSGAGVYLDNPSSPAFSQVVGVHAYGLVSSNAGRRLDASIANSAAAWCTANACSLSIYYEGTSFRLALTSAPTSGTLGVVLAPISVQVLDSSGANVSSNNSSLVTLSATGPGTLTCPGGLNQTSVSGAATFTGCTVNVAGSYTFSVSSAGLYPTTSNAVIVGNPAPQATSTVPASAAVGGSAFQLTVNGSNFIAGSVVNWNGSPRTTTYISSTQLTAAIPASDLVAAGTASVTVTNPAPGGGTSGAIPFSLSSPAASKLTFLQQPVGSASGTALAVQPVIAVQDASSTTVVSDQTTAVTLSLQGGTGRLWCTGGLVHLVLDGVATFSGCTVTGGSSGLSLHAASIPSLAGADSGSFTMTAAGATGSIRVTTSPAVPSQIFLNGIPRDSWGLTWLEVPAGNYEVSFSDVPGFRTPKPQLVTVTAGATTNFVGAFVQRGYLRVLTNPGLPATISIDGSPRNDWGIWTEFDAGSYQVCFGLVADFAPPACQQAIVTAGVTTTITGTYTPSTGAAGPVAFGYLRVFTSPAAPAQILIDGHPSDSWGITWAKVPPGLHTVTFSGVAGFVALQPQAAMVVQGATTVVSGVLQPTGTLRVLTSPAMAVPIGVDGIPRNDWGLWTDYPPGDYQVCFPHVAGFNDPPCQMANITSGSTINISGTYIP